VAARELLTATLLNDASISDGRGSRRGPSCQARDVKLEPPPEGHRGGPPLRERQRGGRRWQPGEPHL